MIKLSARAMNVAKAVEASGAKVRPARSADYFVIEYPSGTVGTVEARYIKELVGAGMMSEDVLRAGGVR